MDAQPRVSTAEKRRRIQGTIRSLDASATLYAAGGYPPNPVKAQPVSAARCRDMAAAKRRELEALA